MASEQSAATTACQLFLKEELADSSLPIARQDTPLQALKDLAARGPYVLVMDDAGRIVGLVPSCQITDHLNAQNDQERARWAQMPLSSLVSVALPAGTSRPGGLMEQCNDGIAISENGHLLGIAAFGDIFLSYRRLSSVVAGASLDPLTGLINRAAYERRLCEEWERAERVGFSIAVIMVDLDNFKDVNDRFGHDEGDRVIRRVATCLESSLRSYDIAARFGGDEFLALCVGCRAGEIRIPLTRILEAFKASEISLSCGEVNVLASLGAAVCHDGFAEMNPLEMLAAADRCLYRAKAIGGTAFWVEYGSGVDGEPVTFDSPSTKDKNDAVENAELMNY